VGCHMISIPTQTDTTPATDVTDLLTALADRLFDAAVHFRASDSHANATVAIRAGLDLSVRSRYIVSTGKVQSPASATDMLRGLSCTGSIRRPTYRLLSKLWVDGHNLNNRNMDELAAAFRSGTCAETKTPGSPRTRSEARSVYNGLARPVHKARSAVMGRKPR